MLNRSETRRKFFVNFQVQSERAGRHQYVVHYPLHPGGRLQLPLPQQPVSCGQIRGGHLPHERAASAGEAEPCGADESYRAGPPGPRAHQLLYWSVTPVFLFVSFTKIPAREKNLEKYNR